MFDFARFRRLAAAQWAEYRRAYAWFLGIGVIVHFVVVLIVLADDDGFRTLNTAGQGMIYFAGLVLTAPLFAGRYFQAMARRESALILLMRPASTFEKWLLFFLVAGVLYPIAYSLVFYICNLPGWWIAQGQAQEALLQLQGVEEDRQYYAMQLAPENFALFRAWHPSDHWQVNVGWMLLLATIQGFAGLGSLYFKAMPFIKTILAAFLLLLLTILLPMVFGSRPGAFFSYWFEDDRLVTWQQWLFPAAWITIPALLWLACGFALREREIA